MLETTSRASKSISKTNNANQFATKTKIARSKIAKSIIEKFAIAKFVVAKYIAQKSFAIIAQLSNNFYNNIIFNTKNLFRS